jgi:hypothetical protein
LVLAGKPASLERSINNKDKLLPAENHLKNQNFFGFALQEADIGL